MIKFSKKEIRKIKKHIKYLEVTFTVPEGFIRKRDTFAYFERDYILNAHEVNARKPELYQIMFIDHEQYTLINYSAMPINPLFEGENKWEISETWAHKKNYKKANFLHKIWN